MHVCTVLSRRDCTCKVCIHKNMCGKVVQVSHDDTEIPTFASDDDRQLLSSGLPIWKVVRNYVRQNGTMAPVKVFFTNLKYITPRLKAELKKHRS